MLVWPSLIWAQIPPARVDVPPLSSVGCYQLVKDVYGDRLPMPVSGQLVRHAVLCLPGQTKAVQIQHVDHVLEVLSAEDIGRYRPSIGRKGLQNPLVRKHCADPAFRALLDLADVEFLLMANNEPLGAIQITAAMCAEQPDVAASSRRPG
jgi:hypothetical protein